MGGQELGSFYKLEAHGPDYNFNTSFMLNGTKHFCRLLVKEGFITECKIEGSEEMARIAEKLVGCRHMINEILGIFRHEKIVINDNNVFNFF